MRVSDWLATTTLRSTGLSPEPPIDLMLVAAALGVASVRERPMAEAGKLEQGDDGAIHVFLPPAAPVERARFTLAHELGHVLLSDRSETFLSRAERPADPSSIERFCNQYAASLLLPHTWLRAESHALTETLGGVLDVASQAMVSPTAAFVRMRDVFGWTSVLLHLNRCGDEWATTRTFGRALSRPTCTPEGNQILWALLRRPPRSPVRIALPVVAGGRDATFVGQISVRRRSMLAMGKVVR